MEKTRKFDPIQWICDGVTRACTVNLQGRAEIALTIALILSAVASVPLLIIFGWPWLAAVTAIALLFVGRMSTEQRMLFFGGHVLFVGWLISTLPAVLDRL